MGPIAAAAADLLVDAEADAEPDVSLAVAVADAGRLESTASLVKAACTPVAFLHAVGVALAEPVTKDTAAHW
jgi:hypothetical protein